MRLLLPKPYMRLGWGPAPLLLTAPRPAVFVLEGPAVDTGLCLYGSEPPPVLLRAHALDETGRRRQLAVQVSSEDVEVVQVGPASASWLLRRRKPVATPRLRLRCGGSGVEAWAGLHYARFRGELVPLEEACSRWDRRGHRLVQLCGQKEVAAVPVPSELPLAALLTVVQDLVFAWDIGTGNLAVHALPDLRVLWRTGPGVVFTRAFVVSPAADLFGLLTEDGWGLEVYARRGGGFDPPRLVAFPVDLSSRWFTLTAARELVVLPAKFGNRVLTAWVLGGAAPPRSVPTKCYGFECHRGTDAHVVTSHFPVGALV